MTTCAKKKSRSRTSADPRVTKELQLNGFYDGLKGISPRSDTQEYMASYRDGEKTRLQSAAVKL